MFIKLYLISLPIFFVIDIIWLALIANNFYQKHLGFFMASKINWPSALIFYFLYIGGLIIFVIMPSITRNSWINTLLYGAFFGLVCYATYDLSNLATLKNWPLMVTIVDLIWGTFVSSLVSILTYLIAKKIGL